MAAKLKIDLLHLVDTSDEKINTKLLMTSVCGTRKGKAMAGCAFKGALPGQFPDRSQDWSEVNIKFSDSAPLRIKDLATVFGRISRRR